MALYMVVTGIVDNVLLVGVDVLTPPWVDFIVHITAPIVVLADWLYDPPTTRIDLKGMVAWLAFPAVYIVYTLVRGSITDWYPYPFLDPAEVGGYGGVALYAAAIAVAFVIVGLLLRWVGNRRT
ncbi:MAG: Pr6Pr family membrane protein [Acidimicrobiia bacterium]|nr:Pr6Pr family membrane protein [Acidimicrobiia bacterium]